MGLWVNIQPGNINFSQWGTEMLGLPDLSINSINTTLLFVT